MPKSTLLSQRLPALTVATLFAVSGCSSLNSELAGEANAVSIGWYCQAEGDSSANWDCSQRRLRGGIPVESERTSIKNHEVFQGTAAVPSMGTPEPQPASDNIGDQETPLQDGNEPAAFDISARGFTVQLGAYLSQTAAGQVAERIILPAGSVIIQNIMVNNQHLFALVWGQYESRQQAQQNVKQIVELNPELQYWVRSIASMRNSE